MRNHKILFQWELDRGDTIKLLFDGQHELEEHMKKELKCTDITFLGEVVVFRYAEGMRDTAKIEWIEHKTV